MRIHVTRWIALLNRRRTAAVTIGGALLVALLAFSLNAEEWVSGIVWPEPAVVDPGPVGGPPSDAIVLFDGKDLSKWDDADKWMIQDGYAITGGNDIRSKQGFGDCQLHVEWATPEKVEGERPGTRQQRRLLDGAVRGADSRQLQEQDVLRRPGGGHLQAAPAAGERLPQAGRVAEPTTSSSRRRGSTRKASSRGRRSSRCCKTACWCRTTSRFKARRPGTRRRSTRPMRRSCRFNCSTTATRCGSATSGFGSCRRPMPRRRASDRSRPARGITFDREQMFSVRRCHGLSGCER